MKMKSLGYNRIKALLIHTKKRCVGKVLMLTNPVKIFKNKLKHLYGPSSILLLVYLLLLFRLIWFVQQNTVNVLFWDQWDFLTPLFNESTDIWEIFSYQHGPHRQGLGGLINAIIYPLSGWDVRVDVFVSVAIFALSCYLALLIKKRIWGNFTWTDIFIPLSYFTLLQFEIFTAIPNLSHGALPVFLVTLTAYFLSLENQNLKIFALASLIFFTTFTGFAIFSGILIILILLLFTLKASSTRTRIRYMSAVVLSISFFILFFIEYQFNPAIDCFQFPHPQPLEYLSFSIAQFGASWGLINVSSHPQLSIFTVIFSTFLFILLIFIIVYFSFDTIRNMNKKSIVILYLASYTMGFILFTAVGRVCIGIEASHASRYVPYAIPGTLAFYFSYLSLNEHPNFPSKIKKLILLGLFLLMVFKESTIVRHLDSINRQTKRKEAWAKCYLETHDIKICNETTGFKIYPDDAKIQAKLKYLESNNLSFFKEQK